MYKIFVILGKEKSKIPAVLFLYELQLTDIFFIV